jgi:hypothetical protein
VELRHLRYFVAVAEELSFRKAAGRLSVSEPAVSQQVADLENELGQKLFNRGVNSRNGKNRTLSVAERSKWLGNPRKRQRNY